jgi:putative ABC transport system permease protein
LALAAPAQDQTLRVKYGSVNTMSKIMGTTGEWAQIRNFRTTSGRFFTAEENAALARVGVIGSQVRDVLFPDSDPIGETIRVGRVPIEVIGVLESKGVSVDGSAREDNQVVVPINTALRRIFNVDYLKMIYVQVVAGDRMDRAVAEMTAVLRDRHRLEHLGWEDDFVIQNQAVILEAEMQTAASFRRMITGLGAVALVVGGAGILAIMLLSVKERTNEVGLRTAVGARRRDIRTQFLVEAMMLGGSGGTVGVLAGLAVAWAINATTEWSTVISGPAVAIALGSALLIGIVFGVIPAQKAASLDPIESLRAE